MGHNRSQLRAGYAEKFPALARRRQPLVQRQQRHFDRILLGHDPSGQPLFIPDEVRMMHMSTFGTTGSGKSTYVKNQILQDIRRGYGGILIDPHGGHPGSPYSDCTAQLYEDGFFDTGRIHLIDPNTRFVMPINPLAQVHGADLSVIADAMLKAFEICWGAEDTHQKPTIRTVLRSTFMALTELNLPLAHARLLYDPNDPSGLRARVISQLSNDYARDELSRIHQVALDDRSKREFNALVLGPINRIAEFTSSDAVSAMFSVVDEPGQPRRTLDLLDIMNRGEFVFVNCQHGEAFSEADAALLGAIILRYLFLLAPRRTNREPFFVTIDESHRFMVGDDLPSIFAEGRKNGISLHCLLQFEAQAGPRDELTAQAIENCTAVRTVFRVQGPEEAQRHAERVLALSLEMPVKASIRPTVVGHRKVQLASRSSARHEATTEGEAETEGESHGRTTSYTRGESSSTSSSNMTGSGDFSATGENAGTVFTPAWQMFGGNGPTASLTPTPITDSVGTSASRGSSTQSASVEGTSRGTSESWGEAETHSTSRASTRSRSRMNGTSDTRGEADAFESIYADLPASFHSKENELYFKGEIDPPTSDRCLFRRVPRQNHPHHGSGTEEEIVMIDDTRALAARLIAASPLAMSLEEALKQKRERRAALLAAPPTAVSQKVEPDFTAPAPVPPTITEAPEAWGANFWQQRETAPPKPAKAKKPKSPPGRRPIGAQLNDRHNKFGVIEGKLGDGDVDKPK